MLGSRAMEDKRMEIAWLGEEDELGDK